MPTATSTQIASYETAPARLTMTLEGLSDAQIRYTPGEQEWSIHNIIIHMADAELVGSWRLRKTLAEAPVALQDYDEAAWASQLVYPEQRRDHALALFTMLRTTNAALLRLLPARAWERAARRETGKEMNVYELFLTLHNHVDEHIRQIERIKQHLPGLYA